MLDANLQVVMVHRSMPDFFNHLTMALESRPDADLTFELAEVDRRSGQPVVMAGTKKQFICHHCHKAGHKQKDCHFLAQDREEETLKNEPTKAPQNKPVLRKIGYEE